MRTRVAAMLLGLGGVLVVGATVVLFSWSVDETRFDRPSPQFDAFVAEVERLPGVHDVDAARWVDAPGFGSPQAWIGLVVAERSLPGLLDHACDAGHPDPVSWSLTVSTPAGTEVSAHGAPGDADAGACPDFGFDVVRVARVIDDIAPGLAVQPAVWDDDRFALVEVDGRADGYGPLLPLAAAADEVLEAAGRSPRDTVEINSVTLGITVPGHEGDRYVDLLRELADEYGVSSLWTGTADAPAGAETVNVVAPDGHRAAIEREIRDSGLSIAEATVVFRAP